MTDSRLVYSTETGRICPSCKQPKATCSCRKKRSAPSHGSSGNGVVHIRREIKGRKGKGVTMVSGVALDNDAMKQLAARLKRLCATGGSIKGGTIIIQGDHRKIIQQSLQEIGFTVKMAGG